MKKLFLLTFALLLCGFTSADVIKPNQALQITIQGVPPAEASRLNSKYQVSSSGYITMWQIGSVKASGRNKQQLAAAIAAAYRSKGIYNAPVFQVTSQSEEQRVALTFTVGGQVKGPGPKPYRDGLTLFEAVQAAGGPTPFGAMNRVKLFRAGKMKEYNLKNDTHKGIRVYASDTIEVPQKRWNGT